MSIVVFGKPNCPYCDRAKELLHNKAYDFEYVDVAANPKNLERMVVEVTEHTKFPPRTVPQIIVDNKYVGGYTELVALNLPSNVNVDFTEDDLGDL
jgi:glutaredoxin